ncbi:MAG: ABC-F family ATP-binding cassette domain-containing protein [Myxococcales bacterium]|nr:ABC-F family ATP-binding cassette domain-containing protein [Myxococcales bacterium]
MSLVVLEQVSLGFGAQIIVDSLNLRIGREDRIGLVGANGSGKSTLMRMIAGEQSPDAGALRSARRLRIGYLPQDIAVAGGRPLGEFVTASVPGRAALDDELARVEEALAVAQRAHDEAPGETAAEALMDAAGSLADVHEQIAHFEEHYSEHEALRILAGLGFAAGDERRDLGEFSGGWKMRAVLAALLFQRPDLLLLDEPTNHLDLPSVAWFSAFLRRYSRAFMLVCHDREFLNEQISRVIAFEPEGVRQFTGDYEGYRRQRAEEETVLQNQARNLGREREKAERFIERFRAKASKAKAVQSRVKALDKMDEVRTFERRQVMRLHFPPCKRTGAQAIHIQGLAKAFGEHEVFSDVELRAARGDKIGIIGVNGAGKTTLLRIVAGELAASAGQVVFGAHVEVGHYAQHHAEALDGSRTVFEELQARAPDAGPTPIRTLLGAFLFRGDDVDKPISVLSGGERARVALARLLIRPGNVLLMDEPTNHLDLESSEALAESLAEFDGTLLFVSHNRSFVRRLATKIWDVHDGRVEVYPGTLDEYLDRSRKLREGTGEIEASAPATLTPAQHKPAPAPEPVEDAANARARRRERARERARRERAIGPLKREVTTMEEQIAAIEKAQRERSAALADPAIYDDTARRSELLDAYGADAERLEDLTARWEVAQGALEEAEAQLDD